MQQAATSYLGAQAVGVVWAESIKPATRKAWRNEWQYNETDALARVRMAMPRALPDGSREWRALARVCNEAASRRFEEMRWC